jgi:hypothetical protein
LAEMLASLETTPMDPETSKPLAAFGFLTAVEDPLHGFFGGYLVLSERGRPLEFHCSTPVLPSEAQRILFGASLRPYLLGELIGQTLVSKAQVPVQAVLTDVAEMRSLAGGCSAPVACLRHVEISTDSETNSPPESPEVVLGQYLLLGTTSCSWQPDWLRQTLAPLATHVDLAEPFERIREAIREAQRVTEPPGESEHESSAAA